MPAPAVERRIDAIHAVARYVFPTRESVVILRKREDIATRIEALDSLGRTERWKGAVDAWAYVVRTEPALRWAFIQWHVYAAHAAE